MLTRCYRYLPLFGLMSVTGCVTEGAFEYSMRTMVGHPIARYEKIAGSPSRIEHAPNGNAVYVYKLKNYEACTVYWEVDKQGVVINWWHRGKDCTAPWF